MRSGEKKERHHFCIPRQWPIKLILKLLFSGKEVALSFVIAIILLEITNLEWQSLRFSEWHKNIGKRIWENTSRIEISIHSWSMWKQLSIYVRHCLLINCKKVVNIILFMCSVTHGIYFLKCSFSSLLLRVRGKRMLHLVKARLDKLWFVNMNHTNKQTFDWLIEPGSIVTVSNGHCKANTPWMKHCFLSYLQISWLGNLNRVIQQAIQDWEQKNRRSVC